jgi:hypothetical protein
VCAWVRACMCNICSYERWHIESNLFQSSIVLKQLSHLLLLGLVKIMWLFCIALHILKLFCIFVHNDNSSPYIAIYHWSQFRKLGFIKGATKVLCFLTKNKKGIILIHCYNWRHYSICLVTLETQTSSIELNAEVYIDRFVNNQLKTLACE